MCKIKLHSSLSILRNVFVFLFLIITVFQARSVYAFTIDIITFNPSLFEVSINYIQESDQNKVYTVDPEHGTVTFGDGEPGDRLPVDSGGIIGSYSRGGGASGNVPDGIFNTYMIPPDFSPFPLPESFFSVYHNGKTDFSFVLSGLSSIELKITGSSMWITNVTPAPEPATFILMLAGLACMAFFVHIRHIRRI
ncbi:MAG: PEP-CTERM sorting domain-containing protein [Nitrospirae bacterium]|nr:PEP-CTERM sorting domain-containing protein [Nitrospirota bacterium]